MSAPERALDVAERTRILRDGFVNYSSQLISGVVGVLLIPVIVSGVGAAEYGLWIAALSLSGFVGVFDLGLAWSLTREIAAAASSRRDAGAFVRSASLVFVAVGLVGAGVVLAMALPTAATLPLSAADRALVLPLFAATALGFFAGHLLFYSLGILHGVRRFGAANLLTASSVLLRAVGIVVLIHAGRGVVALALWSGVSLLVVALCGMVIVSWLEPAFRPGWGGFDFGAVRPHLGFGVKSQVVTLAIRAVWDAPVLVISYLAGTAALVPYHLGQKFPLAASEVNWRIAESLFPAASEHASARNHAGTRDVVEVGTRSVLVVALPACALLWLIAPSLVTVWLDAPNPVVTHVLRVMAAAVLADAVGVGAMHVLWAAGRIRTVVGVLAGMAVGVIGLSLFAVPRFAAIGAVWCFLIPMMVGAVLFVRFAARASQARGTTLLRSALSGLWVPLGASMIVVGGLQAVLDPRSWLPLGFVVLLGITVYGAVLYRTTPRDEERAIVAAAGRALRDLFLAALRRRRGSRAEGGHPAAPPRIGHPAADPADV